MVDKRPPGIAVGAHQAGGQRRGPEPVSGPGEPCAGVGGVHAGVQAADQQAHLRSHGVGQGSGSASFDDERGRFGGPTHPLHAVQGEPGTFHKGRYPVLGPLGEAAPGEVIVGKRLEIGISLENMELYWGAGGQRPMQVGQRQGNMTAI